MEFFFLKILICCLVGEKVREKRNCGRNVFVCFFFKFLSCLYGVFLLENLDFLPGCDTVEFDCLVGEKVQESRTEKKNL